MSWPLVKLGTVCEKVSVGHVGKTSEFYTDESGIPFLRTQNVSKKGLNLNDVMYVTKDFHDKLKKSQLQAGDVILSRVISNRINCAVVPSDLGEANCANIILARPNPEKLDSQFLLYYLKSTTAQRLLIGRQVGSAQSVVNTSVLKSWVIPLPPLPEQKRIAAILDKADQLRQKRQQAIGLADEFLRSVFLEMFGDPVTNPKGWEERPIGNSFESIDGGWSASGENEAAAQDQLGVLKISSVTSGKFLPEENKLINPDIVGERKLLFPRKGDLLFSRANTRELVAATVVVDQNYDHVFSSR